MPAAHGRYPQHEKAGPTGAHPHLFTSSVHHHLFGLCMLNESHHKMGRTPMAKLFHFLKFMAIMAIWLWLISSIYLIVTL